MNNHKLQFLIIVLLFPVLILGSCSQITGKLDDQAPVLLTLIETTDVTGSPDPPVRISKSQPVYLIYYTNNDWTNPWLVQPSAVPTILNPCVGLLSTYIMVFWDRNGNGIVDVGEPCTGYFYKYHTNPTPQTLTPLVLLPLEWRVVVLTLDNDPAHSYQ